MLVYAGIDEAGYGPMFGPLVIARSVFTLADADPAADEGATAEGARRVAHPDATPGEGVTAEAVRRVTFAGEAGEGDT